MKFLPNSHRIRTEIKRLISKYPKYRWAVAWASEAFDCCDLLKEKADRISQM